MNNPLNELIRQICGTVDPIDFAHWLRAQGYLRPNDDGIEMLHTTRGTTAIEMAQYQAYADRMRPAKPAIVFVVPRETKASVNQREHRMERASRTQSERNDTHWLMRAHKVPADRKLVRARLVRYHTHLPLDDDNLASALKAIRDEIADYFGIDDSARSGVEWPRDQEKVGRESLLNGHVRVELTLEG